ncbi:MAG: hypothetical protein QM398_02225 [Thermoproteota archaeon]|nr:hypothetical protein [Thermoproteota archaeon]NLD64978.1 hypothetical protein [Thermoproteota archaeon]
MRKYRTWAYLNAEGKQAWGDVFSEGEVPIQDINSHPAVLESIQRTERVFLVDWKALTAKQQDGILEKLSQKTGEGKEVILKEVLRVGLPLREVYTEGVGTSRMGALT